MNRLTTEISHFSSTTEVVSFLCTVEDKCVARGIKKRMPIVAGRLLEGAALTWYNTEVNLETKHSSGKFQECFVKRFSDGKSKDMLLE